MWCPTTPVPTPVLNLHFSDVVGVDRSGATYTCELEYYGYGYTVPEPSAVSWVSNGEFLTDGVNSNHCAGKRKGGHSQPPTAARARTQ